METGENNQILFLNCYNPKEAFDEQKESVNEIVNNWIAQTLSNNNHICSVNEEESKVLTNHLMTLLNSYPPMVFLLLIM